MDELSYSAREESDYLIDAFHEDMMEDHNPEATLQERQDDSAGSYHCKSALRDHQSNMKLSSYRRDFQYLYDNTKAPHYDDGYLSLLSRIWNCMFLKKKDLNGISRSDSSKHASPCQKLSAFTKHITNTSEINLERYIRLIITELRSLEFGAFSDISITNMMSSIMRMFVDCLPILAFLNSCAICMNHKNDASLLPDIGLYSLAGFVKFDLDEGYFKLFYNSDFIIMIKGTAVETKCGGYHQIIHKDMLLTLIDKLQERFNVIVLCMIKDETEKTDILDTTFDDVSMTTWVKLVKNLMDIGDKIIKETGNSGFKILGKFEAYCVATLTSYDDEDLWDSQEFLRNLQEDDKDTLTDKELDLSLELVQELKKMNIRQLGEVHGLWRIWGHPIIELEAGLRKMEATSIAIKPVDYNETLIGERTFKQILFVNYFDKHKFYPLSNVSKKEDFLLYSSYMSANDISTWEEGSESVMNSSSYIVSCIRKGKEIDKDNIRYVHEEWDMITPLQNFKISSTMNLSTMIKDKAVTMDRDELITSVKLRRSVFDRTKRRGVLKWLGKQVESVTDFLRGIDRSGIPENERIIGLYPKEREMKIQARFFSLMSYKIRMYITITEEILSKMFLPYFPMITMSDNMLQMVMRLYNMTSPIGTSEDSVSYCMNIDFSKWNQNMRYETNSNIFSNIDKMLGFTNLINYTHKLFHSCYLYLCSGEYTPDVSEGKLGIISPWSRTNDGSGKEGLRQKGWTITTVCDILSLSHRHKVTIELIGGGDNQVLTIKIPLEKGDQKIAKSKVKRRMQAFRDDLANKMKKRGLPLKIEETWISPSLLMYNKIMYYNKVPLCSTLKIASRCFSFSNEGVMTIGNISSTLGTSYQAISSKDNDPVNAFLFSRASIFINITLLFFINPISKLTSLSHFMRQLPDKTELDDYESEDWIELIRRKGKKSTTTNTSISVEQLLMATLYFHKIFGGISIGTPYSLIMKGFPDPLSEALSYNYRIIKALGDNRLKKYVTNFTKIIKKKGKPNWEHLVEDPVSVNHDAPQHGLSHLRQVSESALRGANIENIFFKELLEVGDNSQLKDFANSLCSANVLEPRVIHDIVGATIPGYVNTITSKVDKSTTINKLSSNSQTILRTYLTEIQYLKYLSKKSNISNGHEFGCPSQDAKNLRDTTWGKSIEGVTVPHPSAFLVKVPHHNTDPYCDQNHISVFKKFRDYDPLKRGPYRPYFGSYTEEKFKHGELASAFGEEDVLKRAVRIQKLIHWRYHPDSIMGKIIKGVLECVTNVDPVKLEPSIDDITGDVQHRYHDMATKHGGIPSNLFTKYSYITSSTSTYSLHSKGGGNENIHFQACIIYCNMMAILDMRGSRRDVMYHFHESCRSCIQPILIPTPEETNPVIDAHLTCIRNNPLLFVKEEDVPMHFHNIVKLNKRSKTEITSRENVTSYKKAMGSAILEFSKMMCCRERMKESTKRLFIEKLDDNEIALLCSLLCIGMWSEKGAIGDINLVQTIMDITNYYLEPLTSVFCWISTSSLLFSNKISIGSLRKNDIVEILLLGKENCPVLNKENILVNESGSRWDTSFKIWMYYMNKESVDCECCKDIISKFCKRETHMTCCVVHGELIFPNKSYSYSFDRLCKEMGQLEKEKIWKKRRLYPVSELTSISIPEKNIMYDISSFDVTDYMLIDYKSDKNAYFNSYDKSYLLNDNHINILKMILISNFIRDKNYHDVVIETFDDLQQCKLFLSVLNTILPRRVNVWFVYLNMMNLENYRQDIFDEIHVFSRSLRRIICRSLGDMHLDPLSVMKESKCGEIFINNVGSVMSMNGTREVILSCSTMEFERGVQSMNNLECVEYKIVIGDFRASNNFPFLICGKHDGRCYLPGGSKFINRSHIISLLDNVKGAKWGDVCDLFSKIEKEDKLYARFLRWLPVITPIVSEAGLKNYENRLINLLFMHHLSALRSKNIWFCTSILECLICLDILTSSNIDEAIRHYSRCSTYTINTKTKRILLKFKQDSGKLGLDAIKRLKYVEDRFYINYSKIFSSKTYYSI